MEDGRLILDSRGALVLWRLLEAVFGGKWGPATPTTISNSGLTLPVGVDFLGCEWWIAPDDWYREVLTRNFAYSHLANKARLTATLFGLSQEWKAMNERAVCIIPAEAERKQMVKILNALLDPQRPLEIAMGCLVYAYHGTIMVEDVNSECWDRSLKTISEKQPLTARIIYNSLPVLTELAKPV